MGERIGMLGGTFDPPHVGHAIVAQEVFEALALDLLLVIPAARPPHRQAILPAEVRYELVRRLFGEVPGVEASGLEMSRPGPSYTVDTLAQIREERAPQELFCIMGSDQFQVIRDWHDYERLPKLAALVVMIRGGEDPEPRGPKIPHTTVRVSRVELSSTRVRERLRAGRPVRFLVPEVIRGQLELAWSALAAP